MAENLKQLIENRSHTGFKLVIGFYAELKHGLWGCFPAIESGTGEMIFTTDPDLIKRVCENLPPRRFNFGTQILYVNEETGVAFSVIGTKDHELEKATPFQLLTQRRFDELMRMEKPFKWAPGLVGDDMSAEEFRETLEAAQKKLAPQN